MQFTRQMMAFNLFGLAAFGVASFAALTHSKIIANEFKVVTQQTLPMVDALQDLRSDTLRIVASTNEHLFLLTTADSAENKKELGDAIETENKLSENGNSALETDLQRYSDLARKYLPGEDARTPEIKSSSGQLTDIASELFAMIEQGARADELLQAKERLETAEMTTLKAIGAAIEKLERTLSSNKELVHQTISRGGLATLAIVGLLFLIMLAGSTLLSRAVVKKIRKLQAGLNDVARGNFVQLEHGTGKDELDGLTSAFSKMSEALHLAAEKDAAAEASLIELNTKLEQKVVERTSEMQAAKTEAETANRAKSLFLANMSHEIRTPMNGVFGMTDLLMRTELTDRQRRFVGTISQSAKTLLTIINDILDITRIESNKLELDVANMDLRQCVEDAVMLFADQAESKDLELAYHIAEDVPHFVKGDAGRIRQICVNLIGNAVKFTAVGEVTVRVRQGLMDSGTATTEIEVRDTGIGMNASTLSRSFKPFAQGDASISRRFGGTGLGLAISSQLAQLMDGTITVESKLDQGTCVVCALPLPSTQRACRPKRPELDRLVGKRILVVDDHATIRDIAVDYLTGAGADVAAAATAVEAEAVLAQALEDQRPFAVLVCDAVLGGTCSLYSAARLHDDPNFAGLKVILLTSMGWKGDADAIQASGVAALLTKPLRRDELLQTVARTLSGTAKSLNDVLTQLVQDTETQFTGHVLLAEDNPVNIEVASEYLRSFGCTFDVALTGAEAVAAFRTTTFDLILMDVQMPEMDGVQATHHIREISKAEQRTRTPIVAVTANAFEADRKLCMAANMDGFLSKPFTDKQLEQVLSKWLKRAEADTPARRAAV
jgi:signal transduction histidine kinase/CheY-like chemotaxis protein